MKNAGTTCTQGTQTTSCSVTPPGTPSPNFLCDASYASGCGQPACTGNVLAQTLGTAGLIAAVPDLAGTNLPTGMCATPPCYGTNLLAGCQGVPINPSGNSTCGTGPPVDNTKAHAWVGPSIPTGTTVTLTGAGAMTTFLESTTGAAVNATLCLRLYVVPNSSLGLLNSLLSTPISAVISASVTAAAGVPAPATFEFPSSAITANTAVSASPGPVRIEFVVWIAGSTSPVQMVYDQAQYASEITLMTK